MRLPDALPGDGPILSAGRLLPPPQWPGPSVEITGIFHALARFLQISINASSLADISDEPSDDFDQYGFSISLLRNIFDTFYINLDYDIKAKNVLNEDNYDNSYFIIRLGYQF